MQLAADGDGLVAVDKGGQPAALGMQTCMVCLGEFAAGEQVRKLFCGHFFHQQCIDEWLERSTRCPTDNVEIS